VIASTGIYVDGLGHLFGTDELRLHLLGIPITIVAVVGLINAFNMLDGIDGLAGSLAMVSIVSILAFSGAGWPTLGVALLLQILSIALIPYLCVNLGWPDGRKIFMGDAGSTLIGFLLAWSLIFMSHRNVARLAPVDVLWCIALPVMDTLAVMYRRSRKGLSPFKPDRQHLHHLLLDAGCSTRQALVLIVAAGSLLAATGYALRDVPELVSLIAFATMLAVYVLWLPKPLEWLSLARSNPVPARDLVMRTDIALDQGLVLEQGPDDSAQRLPDALPAAFEASGSLRQELSPAESFGSGPGLSTDATSSLVKTLCVIGASPDDIRMAPIVQLLSRDDRFDAKLCVAAPSGNGTAQVLDLFGIRSDLDSDIARDEQDPVSVASATLGGMNRVLSEFQPDVVLVHGDTPTSLATALAAYYQKIPLVHVETGSPVDNAATNWAGDTNRKIISTLASLHFTPSERAGRDLVATGIPEERVTVAGNTAVDTLRAAVMGIRQDAKLKLQLARRFPFLRPGSPLLFVARRGMPVASFDPVSHAIRELAKTRQDLDIVVYPSSPDSGERGSAKDASDPANVHRPDALDYLSFAYLLDAAYLILAGAGDIEREATLLSKPVLILRDDAMDTPMNDCDNVKWIDNHEREIAECLMALLTDRSSYEAMSLAAQPDQDAEAYLCIAEKLAGLPQKTSSLAA